MTELELELTYLAKYFPEDIATNPSEIVEDIYIPEDRDHASLRVRRKGSNYEITKKEPVDGTDSSRQNEHTIPLVEDEYLALARCSKKIAKKRRYYTEINGYKAEIDVFQDNLAGLVLIDFEFDSDAAMRQFTPPDICLADVSQEAFIAGGKLAGKTYQDIQAQLETYNYQPLFMERSTT
ncbi:MAG TPA: hypothetical protein VD907_04950 [Verrucomicrobiae bacterium]|nr:hypothetical protein [Verrucomicrobiae bacterium]